MNKGFTVIETCVTLVIFSFIVMLISIATLTLKKELRINNENYPFELLKDINVRYKSKKPVVLDRLADGKTILVGNDFGVMWITEGKSIRIEDFTYDVEVTKISYDNKILFVKYLYHNKNYSFILECM